MVRGGIKISTESVELSLFIRGGKPATLVYNDVVTAAIDKFSLISSMLSKLLSDDPSPSDIGFFINQVDHLLYRAHVELIPGKHPFQQKYNLRLLDAYVCMLLETTDIKLISELLFLDSILYTIEEVSAKDGYPLTLDFDIPSKLQVRTLADLVPDTTISFSKTDESNAYLHSLNTSINHLNTVIVANKQVLHEIYKIICNVAAQYMK